MCLNCGCGDPQDRHGSDANITLEDLEAASKANGQSMHETIDHIERSLDQVESQQFGVGSSSQGRAQA